MIIPQQAKLYNTYKNTKLKLLKTNGYTIYKFFEFSSGFE
jgi:hypothetical protein